MLANYADIWHRIAMRVPDQLAIDEVDGRRYSYRAFDDAAARLASFLTARGLHAGDKIAIFMHNRPEWALTLFAALKLGVAPVPINYRYRAGEVDALLIDADAAALVYPSSLRDVVTQLESSTRRALLRIEVDDEHRPIEGEAFSFDAALLEEPLDVAAAPPQSELFLYTGGTTGQPKGVVWGVEEMLDVQMFAAYGSLGLALPTTIDEAVGIAADPSTPRPVTFPLAPLMHGTAYTTTINTLLLGGTVVIASSARFDPRMTRKALATHGVTRLIVAGDSVALRVLDALGPAARLPRLQSVMSSGMRFSDETKAKLHALGDLVITDLVAASEGGPFAVAITRSADDLPARLRLTPGTILVDENLHLIPLEPGQVGMLAFGGSLPKGYYKDEAKTAQVFPVIGSRRHVVPGDWARVEPDGSIELLGRGSSVINTGGEKVYPVEIEDALLTHPAVVDAVVFGTPDPSWGEIVTAAVAVRDPSGTSPHELIAHVGGLVAGYKKPKRILIRTTLDRTPSGKVDMRALRDAATAMTGAP